MIDLPGVAEVWAVLPEARIVGGAVRDSLSGRAVADVDFASPALPEDVMARLKAARIKCVPTGLSHGTVTAVIGGRGFEITTLRRDVQTDGRHAVVAFTDDWEADAARRDFTVNAMSTTADGTVFDYFGGRDDLAAGRVRFVGDAMARIAEDFLRMMRFFRFWARYGRGEADGEAVAAISRLRAGIHTLSVERVWSELKRILLADDPVPALRLMEETGVLPLLLPEADLVHVAQLVGFGAPADPVLRVAALIKDGAMEFAARFKLSGEEAERLLLLHAPHHLAPNADDASLRRALAVDTPDLLMSKTWLAQDEARGWDALRARIGASERPVFPVHGRDLLDLGLTPGPELGKTLGRVRDWWMAGGCTADAAACLKVALAAG